MTTQPTTHTNPPACDLSALTVQERERHIANTQELFAAVQEVHELADGYALRLPRTSAAIAQVADFIAYDRRCCPFLQFSMVVEPENGQVWLKLTGDSQAKAYLNDEMACAFPDRV